MKKLDFYIGFKDFNILAVDSNLRISVSRNILVFLEKRFCDHQYKICLCSKFKSSSVPLRKISTSNGKILASFYFALFWEVRHFRQKFLVSLQVRFILPIPPSLPVKNTFWAYSPQNTFTYTYDHLHTMSLILTACFSNTASAVSLLMNILMPKV